MELEYKRTIFPHAGKNMMPKNRFGKLRKSSKPVVGIFGTSSSQGEFTLQVKLYHELSLQNYYVGFIATEPSGYL